MIASVVFLVVFVVGAFFGVVHDWWSWFYGLTFGVSIARVVEYLEKRERPFRQLK